MASWQDAIERLKDRIESHSPEIDPQNRYRLTPAVMGVRIDRHFLIVGPASLEIGSTSNGDPMVGSVVVQVYYSVRTQVTETLKYMGRDAEDLIQRIHYVPGAAWAQSDGYSYYVNDEVTIEQDEEGGIMGIPVSFIYNMR